MSESCIVDVLERAVEHMEEGWTRDVLYRDMHGQPIRDSYGYENLGFEESMIPEIASCCAEGATRWAAFEKGCDYKEAWNFVADYFRNNHGISGLVFNIPTYNDSHNKEDVIALFNNAINEYKKEYA